MKALLFIVALLALTSHEACQAQGAFKFHYVIKRKGLLGRGFNRYSMEYKIDTNTLKITVDTIFTMRCGDSLFPMNKRSHDSLLRHPHDCCVHKIKVVKEYICRPTVNPIPVRGTYPGRVFGPQPAAPYTIAYCDTECQPQYLVMWHRKLKCDLSTTTDGIVVDFWSVTNSYRNWWQPFRKYTQGTPPPPTQISHATPIQSPSNFLIRLSPRGTLAYPRYYERVAYRSGVLGVSAITFRYRPRQDSASATVTSALALNFNIGYAWGNTLFTTKRSTHYGFIAGTFVGMSSAELSAKTAKRPIWWADSKQKDRTNAVFSYGANAIFNRNNFGIVFSVGFDVNIGFNAREWAYQNKPWIGIGINAGLGLF